MTIVYILIALLALMFMVTIHELGHYTAGKLLGFRINEFAIGMGPKIFSRNMKSGEVFSIRAFPLGGFCAFEGEDAEGTEQGSFNSQKPWKRIIVLVMGATFNFLSAIIIAFLAFAIFGNALPTVNKIYEGSPNYESGIIREGDVIYSVNGKKILLYLDLSDYLKEAPETFDVEVIRNGEKIRLEGLKKGNYIAKEYKRDENGEIVRDENGKPVYTSVEAYGLGIAITQTMVRTGIGEAFVDSAPYCLRAGGYIWKSLFDLIGGKGSIDDIGGPITTITMMTQVSATGFSNILFMIILISVNLAIFNLLPIPALDGARVVFVIIEWIRGKPIKRSVEGTIHTVGLIVLFLLVILVDVIKLFR